MAIFVHARSDHYRIPPAVQERFSGYEVELPDLNVVPLPLFQEDVPSSSCLRCFTRLRIHILSYFSSLDSFPLERIGALASALLFKKGLRATATGITPECAVTRIHFPYYETLEILKYRERSLLLDLHKTPTAGWEAFIAESQKLCNPLFVGAVLSDNLDCLLDGAGGVNFELALKSSLRKEEYYFAFSYFASRGNLPALKQLFANLPFQGKDIPLLLAKAHLVAKQFGHRESALYLKECIEQRKNGDEKEGDSFYPSLENESSS